jgi:hypothetical protein
MKRKQFLFYLLFLFSFEVSAQEKVNIMDILGIQQQVDSLDQRIKKLINQAPYLKHNRGLKHYHIFELYAPQQSIIEHLFDNITNIKELSCCYSEKKRSLFCFKKKHFLRTRTIVCDSLGNVLAIGDWRKLYRIEPHLQRTTYKGEMDLVRYFIEHRLTGAFKLGTVTSSGACVMPLTLYGIDKKDYYLLDLKLYQGLKLVVLDDEKKGECIKEMRYLYKEF